MHCISAVLAMDRLNGRSHGSGIAKVHIRNKQTNKQQNKLTAIECEITNGRGLGFFSWWPFIVTELFLLLELV